VSARHLSFVETGRAQPSRELVSQLADALDVPLRERNALLVSAGYAPEIRETTLSAPEMTQTRMAIDFILRQQEPYPAFVLNRHWDLLMSNRASKRVFGFLIGNRPRHQNIMRQIFDPASLRECVVNWEEVAGDMIRHLHGDAAAAQSDSRMSSLLNEVLAYPGVPSRWRTRELGAQAAPLLTAIYRAGDVELRFFSTVTRFGAPQDLTLDELRIECSFPADDATDHFCRELATTAERGG